MDFRVLKEVKVFLKVNFFYISECRDENQEIGRNVAEAKGY